MTPRRSSVRPWTPTDDDRLRALAIAGASAKAIAIELDRSQIGIRSRAVRLKIILIKSTQLTREGAAGERITKPGPRPKTPRGTWYVSLETKERLLGQRGFVRKTETFRSEQDAKAFAKAKLADGSNIIAGTLNPHQPKRTIVLAQMLDWLNEPND
jgi:hypothetical protein